MQKTRNTPAQVRQIGTILLVFICIGLIVRGIRANLYVREGSQRTSTEPLDFSVRETSRAHGLQFRHQHIDVPEVYPIGPWIQGSGVNVAVADVNHDGYMDIFVTNNKLGSKNALFINDGTGHFKDMADKYNLADLNQKRFSMRAAFFDCDNDGQLELLLTMSDCPRLYKQDRAGRYQEQPGAFPPEACGITEAASVLDINRDGNLDVLLGGVASQAMGWDPLPTNMVEAKNGGAFHVLLNNGQCHFTSDNDLLNPGGQFFYHSLGVGDLRNTGHADVYAATDFSSDKIFMNTRGHEYQLLPPPYVNARSGMNSEVMYLDGVDYPYVFVTHVFHTLFITGGNSFWQYDGHEFKDRAVEKGLHQCGWCWGARAIDLNNDGLLDLAVANGFISGDEKKDYWFSFSSVVASGEWITKNFFFWPNMNGRDLSGHERDCLFLNRGDHFENIASEVSFDDALEDGRAVAVIDSDNKGVQSLIVANQNGNLRYYTIDLKEKNSWIGFDLSSDHGNREAYGTSVKVFAENKVFRREKYTLNTYSSQSDPRLHFGLGKIKKVDRVEIKWPDGKVEEFNNLHLNRYHHFMEKFN